MILRLFPPGERECLVAATVGEKLGFAGRLRFFGDQSAANSQIDSISRKLYRCARHPRLGGRKRKAFVARRSCDWDVDIELQYPAPGMREQRRQMRSAFALRTWHE